MKNYEKITINNIEVEIPEETVQKLKSLFKKPSIGELTKELTPFCKTSIEEYISSMSGVKTFSRLSDLIEYRLYLLIKNDTFKSKVPTEDALCRLFQTGITRTRNLISNVFSKYQYELTEIVNSIIKDILNKAVQSEDECILTIENRYVVDLLNEKLFQLDGLRLTKKKGTLTKYGIPLTTKSKLESQL